MLAQIEREDFDCYYDSDMSEDAKRDFEDRYEAYKREKERAVRAAKHHKKTQGGSKPSASRELFTEAALTAPGLRTILSQDAHRIEEPSLDALMRNAATPKTLFDRDHMRRPSKSFISQRKLQSNLLNIAEECHEGSEQNPFGAKKRVSLNMPIII